MTNARLAELRDFYYRELTEDIVPFWLKHGIDKEQGGLLDFLDIEGKPLSTDKGGWAQGRAAWTFSALYNRLEKRTEYLEAAKTCADFTKDKVLSGPNGRAYFELDCSGRPLVLRRYLFAEAFAMIGLAEYARASGDFAYLKWAKQALATYDQNLGKLPSKVDQQVRPMRGHSDTMLMINVFQIMREVDMDNAHQYTERIRQRIDELFKYFVKPDRKILLETVAEDGSATEGPEAAASIRACY
ncbi:hypothetical protein MASR2M78_13080 [Treponema sp.]